LDPTQTWAATFDCYMDGIGMWSPQIPKAGQGGCSAHATPAAVVVFWT